MNTKKNIKWKMILTFLNTFIMKHDSTHNGVVADRLNILFNDYTYDISFEFTYFLLFSQMGYFSQTKTL